MKIRNFISVLLALVLIFSSALTLLSCEKEEEPEEEEEEEEEEKIGPEVGRWHAEIKLSDISDSMSDDDKLIMSLLAGNTMFEIDAEFGKDYTFTYVLNADKLEDAVSESVSTIFGFFMDFDVSLFVERTIEAAMQDALSGSKGEYAGTYTRTDDNMITATDGEDLYFKVTETLLTQLDEDGNEVIRFHRA